MKIDLELYGPALRGKFPEKSADIDALLVWINGHLPCSECKAVLPKENFVKSVVFKNRDGRSTICKQCQKEYRKS